MTKNFALPASRRPIWAVPWVYVLSPKPYLSIEITGVEGAMVCGYYGA